MNPEYVFRPFDSFLDSWEHFFLIATLLGNVRELIKFYRGLIAQNGFLRKIAQRLSWFVARIFFIEHILVKRFNVFAFLVFRLFTENLLLLGL